MRLLRTLFFAFALTLVGATPALAAGGLPAGPAWASVLAGLLLTLGVLGLGMATQTGTHTIQDLLDVEHSSVAEFGRSTVEDVLQRDLANHRELTEEMIADIAEVTTDKQRIYGASGNTEMIEVDEHGEGFTQEDHDSGETAYPLRKFLHPVGWTNDYESNATPADMAQATLQAEKADVKKVRDRMKKAIFKSSNYTYRDHLIDDVSLSVKRFVNADGDPIPPGPDGTTFDGSTHTHYNAESSLSNAALVTSLEDLQEHGHTNDIKMFIAQGDESTVKGLSDFKEYVDARLTIQADANQPRQQVDPSRPLNNRAIGIFNAAEVWVKPWVPANYIFITDVMAEEDALIYRQHPIAGMQGLRLAAEISDYPLNTQEMEHYFGFGVWNRTNGVVHYFNNGTYSDPSF